MLKPHSKVEISEEWVSPWEKKHLSKGPLNSDAQNWHSPRSGGFLFSSSWVLTSISGSRKRNIKNATPLANIAVYLSTTKELFCLVVCAYGPKTEVAKRFFFESDVLDATLMMGWGGVGWGMLTFVWICWGSWCYADDGVGWGGAC